MKRLRWWLLAIVVAGLFGMLGAWQLGRAQQKRATLAQAEATIAQRHAIALAAASDPARTTNYDWAA